ncbi:hypothetical protein IF1G_09225 [Cordyceps javanica]|uniref:Uncharacterized protein n=1 Tax=Cordyceps javanica TaxID=43265 RepID=A0A545URU1_9HYPO|nr:hypothetical protein IF1G_09225 [Cordyceps javanica]
MCSASRWKSRAATCGQECGLWTHALQGRGGGGDVAGSRGERAPVPGSVGAESMTSQCTRAFAAMVALSPLHCPGASSPWVSAAQSHHGTAFIHTLSSQPQQAFLQYTDTVSTCDETSAFTSRC